MIPTSLKEFIECHTGKMNAVLHVIGLMLFGNSLVEKNVLLVIAGGFSMELGHVFQYSITRNRKHSPWYCAKSQFFIAHALFILAILYVLFI